MDLELLVDVVQVERDSAHGYIEFRGGCFVGVTIDDEFQQLRFLTRQIVRGGLTVVEILGII